MKDLIFYVIFIVGGAVAGYTTFLYKKSELETKEDELKNFAQELEKRYNELKLREKILEKQKKKLETEYKQTLEKEKQEILEEFRQTLQQKITELEKEHQEKLKILLHETLKEVAMKQEEVYKTALETAEREIKRLIKEKHKLGEELNKCQHSLNSLKGQLGARVIDLIKTAPQKWVIKGLKSRPDFKNLIRKLQKV